jgi:hypothetical protein
MDAVLIEEIVRKSIDSHAEELRDVVEKIVADSYDEFIKNGGELWEHRVSSFTRMVLESLLRDRLSGEIGIVVLFPRCVK